MGTRSIIATTNPDFMISAIYCQLDGYPSGVGKLEYKTRLADDSLLMLVNSAYTSQTCSECGHCERNNRESQAEFHCKKCGIRMNADLNAAKNILDRGWRQLSGSDGAGHATTTQDVHPAYRGSDAAVRACGTSAS